MPTMTKIHQIIQINKTNQNNTKTAKIHSFYG